MGPRRTINAESVVMGLPRHVDVGHEEHDENCLIYSILNCTKHDADGMV